MQLQFENHCRQQKIVKDKWKRCKIQQEKVMQERAQMFHLQERQNQEFNEKEPAANVTVNEKEDVEDNKRQTECSQSSSLVISAENFSVSSTSSSSDCNASKDKKVIKELETQVNELQMQVLSLSQDLEDCNRENSRLKKALDTVHKFVRYKFGYELSGQVETGESGIDLEMYAIDAAYQTDCHSVQTGDF